MDVLQEVKAFYDEYKGEKGYIGLTAKGTPIYYMKVGYGKPVMIAQYSIHAREYITAYLALKQIPDPIEKGTVF